MCFLMSCMKGFAKHLVNFMGSKFCFPFYKNILFAGKHKTGGYTCECSYYNWP